MKQQRIDVTSTITVNVKDDYRLMWFNKVPNETLYVAVLKRESLCHPYIVAWAYDIYDGTWGQGHYFETRNDAFNCFLTYIEER